MVVVVGGRGRLRWPGLKKGISFGFCKLLCSDFFSSCIDLDHVLFDRYACSILTLIL